MKQSAINYSQTWEDPDILLEALSIGPEDRVFSISSGGDNTLALALAGARQVDSIDSNPAQNYLVELKLAAARKLNYEEYLELMGVRSSGRRIALYETARQNLSLGARDWWSARSRLIERGVIHCGRFEQFSRMFALRVLPLTHSRKTILSLLNSQSLEEQRRIYTDVWNTRWWRFLFGLASSRTVLKQYARQRGMFAFAKRREASLIYRMRLQRHLTSVPIRGNYFLRYSLTGEYGDSLPPYLEERNKASLSLMPHSRIVLISADILGYLRSLPENTYSAYNVSDVFEAMTPETNDNLWYEIVRTAKSGARVAYWNNLVPRSYPAELNDRIRSDEEFTKKLQSRDRVFFYGRLFVHTITK